MITCSKEMEKLRRQQKQTNLTNNTSPVEYHKCGVITKRMDIVKYQDRPGTAIFQPIYPPYEEENRWKVLGFVPTVLLYDELLDRLFTDKVSGVDCVVSYHHHHYNEEESASITYGITNGIARLM
jgi:hypothetical protein